MAGKITPPKRRALSPKDKAIITEYFKNGFKQEDAYHTVTGAKNSKHAVVVFFRRKEVQRNIEMRQRRSADKAGVDADELLRMTLAIAKANFGDILMKLEKSGYDLKVLTSDERYAMSAFAKKTMKTRGGGTIKEFKVQTRDNLAALKMLMQHKGMFMEKKPNQEAEHLMDRVQEARQRVIEKKQGSRDTL